MAGLNLSPTVQVVPCANYGGTINTSLAKCPFCSFTVDPEASQLAAVEFARVNQAISDASFLRILAVCAVVFFFLRVAPFLGMIGIVGFWVVEIAIPVMAIRWFIRFGSIKPKEKEMERARLTAMIVGICGILFFFIFGLGNLLFHWR